jgi:hypothetical protein
MPDPSEAVEKTSGGGEESGGAQRCNAPPGFIER